MRRRLLMMVLAASTLAPPALFALHVILATENVPIDRVIANLRRMIDQEPGRIEWRINLARLHAMAYAQKIDSIETLKAPEPKQTRPLFPAGPGYEQFKITAPKDAAQAEAAASHLQSAIAAYEDAMAVAPDNSIAQLGLGWCLSLAGQKERAASALRAVVAREWPLEQLKVNVEVGYRSKVEEAALHLIPLLDPVADAAEIAVLRQRSAILAKAGRFITPIAIPLRAGVSAFDVVDEHARVLFDADGSGVPRRWTWIGNQAAWLVFDRKKTGQVTSALQFFGSVTFWLFWENGYGALRALDDSGDGVVSGAELDGLALWHDRNSNGLSDSGEVRTAVDAGITALSTRYEHDATHPDEIAWSPRGVVFASGEVRPTYDIVLRRQR